MLERMRWTPLFVSLALAGCAPPPTRPLAGAVTASPPAVPLECSAFSLLVKQNVATAAAVDPVETQMGIMQSRAFLLGAPAWLASSGKISLLRPGKSALISVRVEAQVSRSSAICDWVQRRVLEMAHNDRASAVTWLSEQVTKLQHDVNASQTELTEFDKKHNELAIGLDAEIELAREEMKALNSAHRAKDNAAQAAQLHAATEHAMQLNLLKNERDALVHRVDATTKLLEMVQERRAAAELDDFTDRPVEVLDRCAPCGPS